MLGVDWTVNLARARAQVGRSKALQGNLDPAVLFAPPEQVAAEARRVLEDFGTPHTGSGTGPTQIFNLGHGISQHTRPNTCSRWSRRSTAFGEDARRFAQVLSRRIRVFPS